MYSKELSKKFEEQEISPGDTLKITNSKYTFEGILLPRPETGDANIIIIKQKDGYNIGVDGKGAEITKLLIKKEKIASQKPELKVNHSLPKVTILYTGGTIGNKLDYTTGAVSPLTKPEELLYDIPELSEIAQIEVRHLSSIASEDMSSDNWVDMATNAASALNNGSRGVVITQGTDTMHYTSAALSFMLKDLNSPVVITGSMKSSDRGSSDAFQNVICSVQLAAKSDIAEVGICMHNSSSDDKCVFLRGTKVRKMHTTRRDTFRPINSTPIAFVDTKGNITKSAEARQISKSETKVTANTGFDKKVALVWAYPDSDTDIIDFYKDKKYTGMIIGGTGLGQTPKGWLPNLKKAAADGMIIGMTSQCLYGRVNPKVYSNARRIEAAGVIYCEDMLPETAYVKLSWLLGNYSREEAKSMLTKNLAGEMAERITQDEFLI